MQQIYLQFHRFLSRIYPKIIVFINVVDTPKFVIFSYSHGLVCTESPSKHSKVIIEAYSILSNVYTQNYRRLHVPDHQYSVVGSYHKILFKESLLKMNKIPRKIIFGSMFLYIWEKERLEVITVKSATFCMCISNDMGYLPIMKKKIVP